MRRRSKPTGRQSMVIMAVFLVVAAVAAVVAGYHLGRVVMQVLFSPSQAVDAPKPGPDQPPPSVVKAQVNLPDIQLQRVQVGAFGKAEGAADKARMMQDEGVPAFVMGPLGDEFYRVVCGLYTDKNAATRVAEAIKKEVFVNELKIPAMEFAMESTDQSALDTLKAAYEFIPQVIVRQAKIWDDYQLGKQSGLEEAATKLAEQVQAQHAAVANLTPPAGLSERHQAVASILDALLRNSVDFEAMIQKRGQEHYVNAATFFVEAVEKYVAHTAR